MPLDGWATLFDYIDNDRKSRPRFVFSAKMQG